MLRTETIKELLFALNEELESRGVLGEIGLCGGAVMCLVFRARGSTKNIDAVFEPTREIWEASFENVESDFLRAIESLVTEELQAAPFLPKGPTDSVA